MSIIAQLALAQQYMTRYGMTTYVALGDIGLLFNIAIFSQPMLRRNTYSLYILATSISAFLGLNISALPVLYQLDHSSPVLTSQLYCQLQFYARHALNQLMRTFFILACADRYAVLNENRRIRSFSQYKIAIRVIPSVILFWLLLSLLPTLLLSTESGKCNTKNDVYYIVFTTYVLLVLGILPLASTTMFSVLLYSNLKSMRQRVQPMTNTNGTVNPGLRKRDRSMLRMLLIEVIFYTITSAPTTVMLIYNAITQTTVKSTERVRIEAFLTYLTSTFLLYGINSVSFWIYICDSRSFRLELKSLIIKCCRFLMCKQASINTIK